MTRYILRLDDACPTMESMAWRSLESLFDELSIRPIVSVIPDNRDVTFAKAPADLDFWNRVRAWQEKDWTIAMHGCTHEYATGESGLVPINKRSEFAGLPLALQREKIAAAWKIFLDNGVRPTVWVAPGHSFDENTLEALRLETPIRTISDGIALREFSRDGFLWIPQQLWNIRWMPWGLFTVCVHPHLMDERRIATFSADLRLYAARVIGADGILPTKRRRSPLDRLFAIAFFAVLRTGRLAGILPR